MPSTPTIEITNPVLLGLICAVGGVKRLPAGCWAIELALDKMDRQKLPASTAVMRTVRRWPRSSGPVSAQFNGLDELLRRLALAGHLCPVGRGWFACYELGAPWLEAHVRLASTLAPGDLRLLKTGAQSLHAALRTWSKKAAASAPLGSATS